MQYLPLSHEFPRTSQCSEAFTGGDVSGVGRVPNKVISMTNYRRELSGSIDSGGVRGGVVIPRF